MIMYEKNEIKKDLFNFKEEFRGNISTPAHIISYGKERMTRGWGQIPRGRSQEAR